MRFLLSSGLGLTGLALLLMYGIKLDSGWTTLLAGFIVGGIGIGLVNAPLASTAVGVVPRAQAGMASGINNTFRQVGISTGIAALGAIFQDKIRSELMRRFDTRTTAGRHIVFCHLLRSVRLGQVEDPWRRFDFAVDRHGILRAVKRVRPRRSALHANLPEPKSVLLRWLGTRRVGERGVRLYWFVLTPSGGFRQASPLDDAEAARFRALPGWFREEWDAFAARPGEGSPSWQAR